MADSWYDVTLRVAKQPDTAFADLDEVKPSGGTMTEDTITLKQQNGCESDLDSCCTDNGVCEADLDWCCTAAASRGTVGIVNSSNTLPLTDEEVRDIAITAAEGGIGYWSVIVSDYTPAKWVDETTFDTAFPFYTILEEEAQENGPVSITPGLIRKGWNTALRAARNAGGWAVQDIAFDPDRVLDVDATVADIIIQFGVFGELVYG